MISKRSRTIDTSGIRKVFDLAGKLSNPINLSIGQPDFDVPEKIKEAAIAAIANGKNGYTQTQGINPLIELVLLQNNAAGRADLDACISSGVSGALNLVYMALLDPGDEILIPDPFFGAYRDLAFLINAVPTYYDTYPDFSLRAESIEKGISERTKAIVICSPSNPTGAVASKEELEAIVALARKHDLWIISDEIYSSFIYETQFCSALSMWDKVIVLGGFSKAFGMTGWRVGFAIGPKPLIEAVRKLQQYTFVCAPQPFQWAALACTDVDTDLIRDNYKNKRDLISSLLVSEFKFQPPQGAFYLFPEAPGGNGQKFVERCVEKGLLVVPGHVFSRQDTHFRISFAASEETLRRGAEVLLEVARGSE